MPEAECVIVGGGIGGAALALALGRHGHRVAVLERQVAASGANRPEILARATMGVFDALGVQGPILRDAAIPLSGVEVWHGARKVLRIEREVFDAAGAQPHSTDPARTREILLERAATIGSVTIERGVEVRAVRREADRTVVAGQRGEQPVEWTGRLVIGDDGARSRVRQAMGVGLRLTPFPLEFVAAAGPALPSLPRSVGQAWIDPAGLARGLFGGLFLPLPEHRTAMVFLMTPAGRARLTGPPERFFRAAARLSPRCEGLEAAYPWDRFARIERPFGHADRYVADGAALLGDAAHPVTPVGGQGANMAVADAAVLAEVAHAALARGDCSAAALQAYEARRRPANARSLAFSVRARGLLRLGLAVPPLTWLVPSLLRRLDRQPARKRALVAALGSAFRSAPA
jgi:2-polyprenyl-6-methoxyphenol hydroxylase-like FAD-dependent oxidoreductase